MIYHYTASASPLHRLCIASASQIAAGDVLTARLFLVLLCGGVLCCG